MEDASRETKVASLSDLTAPEQEFSKSELFDQTWLGPPKLYHEQTDASPFNDPFLIELSLTRPVVRLKRVGFLGAIDYVQHGNGAEPHRRRHNRFDHSVGVAQLALLYSGLVALPAQQARIIAAAALLHDIGHGPLSHTLEPVFRTRYGIDHHYIGDLILMGKSRYKSEIPDLFSAYKVDLHEVIALIEGKHDGSFAHLFSSPINLDTIEAISRCSYFAFADSATPPAYAFVSAMASGRFPTRLGDAFWGLKDAVYRTLIHGRMGSLVDAISQAIVQQRSDLRPDLFFADEHQFRSWSPQLFAILDGVRSIWSVLRRTPHDLLHETISLQMRSFFVNVDAVVSSPDEIGMRYLQLKRTQQMELGDLLPAHESWINKPPIEEQLDLYSEGANGRQGTGTRAI